MSSAPHPWLEQLIAWATPDARQEDLLEARKAWFLSNGEIFEEDRQVELRMSGFLEHYVCDRVSPVLGMTPARARYELALTTETPEQAAAYRCFTESVHGLFEVLKISHHAVRLRGLFSGIRWDVTERRTIVGLKRSDVLEARLLPFGGAIYFSPAYVFHPHEAAPLIKAEAKRLLKAGSVDVPAFVHRCAQRSLKAERYRQIAVEKIYDFTSNKI